METLLLFYLITIPVIGIICLVLYNKEQRKMQQDQYNWNEFIVNNYDNPFTRDTIRKRNELIKTILDNDTSVKWHRLFVAIRIKCNELLKKLSDKWYHLHNAIRHRKK